MMTKRWTEEEIDALKRGILPTNRSADSIRIMRNRLGLAVFKKPKWSEENKLRLRELLAEGKSTREIAQILPHTQRSIQKEIVRQKIPHQKMVRFTEYEKLCFEKFLAENFAQKTTRELVELWNVQNNRKVNERKVVVYLKRLKIKISKAEVIKMTWLRKREKEWLQEKDLDSIRTRRIRIMSERLSKNLDIWTALPCTETICD